MKGLFLFLVACLINIHLQSHLRTFHAECDARTQQICQRPVLVVQLIYFIFCFFQSSCCCCCTCELWRALDRCSLGLWTDSWSGPGCRSPRGHLQPVTWYWSAWHSNQHLYRWDNAGFPRTSYVFTSGRMETLPLSHVVTMHQGQTSSASRYLFIRSWIVKHKLAKSWQVLWSSARKIHTHAHTHIQTVTLNKRPCLIRDTFSAPTPAARQS